MSAQAMAPYSSTLAWRIPWMEEPGGIPWGHEESDTTERLHFHFSLSRTGEGNGNPLQCSCLENPRDGGDWWAAVYGVTQSWTQLMWLISSSNVISLVLVFTFISCSDKPAFYQYLSQKKNLDRKNAFFFNPPYKFQGIILSFLLPILQDF